MHAESNRQVALRSHLQFISLRLASSPPLSLCLPLCFLSLSSSLACFYFVGLSLLCRILLWLSLVFELCQPNWSPPLPTLSTHFQLKVIALQHNWKNECERGRERERACESMRNALESVWRVSSWLPPALSNFCVCPSNCLPLYATSARVRVCVCVFAVWVGQCESRRVEWSGVDCLHLPLKCELLSELVFRIFLSNLFVVCSYLAGAATPLTPLALTPLRVCVGRWVECLSVS